MTPPVSPVVAYQQAKIAAQKEAAQKASQQQQAGYMQNIQDQYYNARRLAYGSPSSPVVQYQQRKMRALKGEMYAPSSPYGNQVSRGLTPEIPQAEQVPQTSEEQFAEWWMKPENRASELAAARAMGWSPVKYDQYMRQQVRSTLFWKSQGYPQYEGKYAPFDTQGRQVKNISESEAGLQIEFETPAQEPVDQEAYMQRLLSPVFAYQESKKLRGMGTNAPISPEDFLSQVGAYRESWKFYRELGYPQYAGKYAPFNVEGKQVKSIIESPKGLEIEFWSSPVVQMQKWKQGLTPVQRMQIAKTQQQALIKAVSPVMRYQAWKTGLTPVQKMQIGKLQLKAISPVIQYQTWKEGLTPIQKQQIDKLQNLTSTTLSLVRQYQTTKTAKQSEEFFKSIGFPQYGGVKEGGLVYKPFEVPFGQYVKGIVPTEGGLAIQTAPYQVLTAKMNQQYKNAVRAGTVTQEMTEVMGDILVAKGQSAFWKKAGYPELAGKYASFYIPEGFKIGALAEGVGGLSFMLVPVGTDMKGIAETIMEKLPKLPAGYQPYGGAEATTKYLLTHPTATGIAQITAAQTGAGAIAAGESFVYGTTKATGSLLSMLTGKPITIPLPRPPPTVAGGLIGKGLEAGFGWAGYKSDALERSLAYGPAYSAGTVIGDVLLSMGISAAADEIWGRLPEKLTTPIEHGVSWVGEKTIGKASKTLSEYIQEPLLTRYEKYGPESLSTLDKWILKHSGVSKSMREVAGSTIMRGYVENPLAGGSLERTLIQKTGQYLPAAEVALPAEELFLRNYPTMEAELASTGAWELTLYAKTSGIAFPKPVIPLEGTLANLVNTEIARIAVKGASESFPLFYSREGTTRMISTPEEFTDFMAKTTEYGFSKSRTTDLLIPEQPFELGGLTPEQISFTPSLAGFTQTPMALELSGLERASLKVRNLGDWLSGQNRGVIGEMAGLYDFQQRLSELPSAFPSYGTAVHVNPPLLPTLELSGIEKTTMRVSNITGIGGSYQEVLQGSSKMGYNTLSALIGTEGEYATRYRQMELYPSPATAPIIGTIGRASSLASFMPEISGESVGVLPKLLPKSYQDFGRKQVSLVIPKGLPSIPSTIQKQYEKLWESPYSASLAKLGLGFASDLDELQTQQSKQLMAVLPQMQFPSILRTTGLGVFAEPKIEVVSRLKPSTFELTKPRKRTDLFPFVIPDIASRLDYSGIVTPIQRADLTQIVAPIQVTTFKWIDFLHNRSTPGWIPVIPTFNLPSAMPRFGNQKRQRGKWFKRKHPIATPQEMMKQVLSGRITGRKNRIPRSFISQPKLLGTKSTRRAKGQLKFKPIHPMSFGKFKLPSVRAIKHKPTRARRKTRGRRRKR